MKIEKKIIFLKYVFLNHKDVQYVDIEYMIGYRDFTVDQKIFSGLGKFVDEQEKEGIRFVFILDPGMYCNENKKYLCLIILILILIGIVIETNNTFYMNGIRKDIFGIF